MLVVVAAQRQQQTEAGRDNNAQMNAGDDDKVNPRFFGSYYSPYGNYYNDYYGAYGGKMASQWPFRWFVNIFIEFFKIRLLPLLLLKRPLLLDTHPIGSVAARFSTFKLL